MGHQDTLTEFHSFSLGHGDKSLSLCALNWSDGSPSPDTTSWLTDSSEFSQRASSKSPSPSSVPSTCSTQDFPPTPPSSSLRLPQVPVVPSIRHRTPQACDKCRERKTKCSGHRPTCVRCNSRGLTCKYSARETRIRGSLKSRTLVQSFDGQSLFSGISERKTDRGGFPTPAHHSRMGSRKTSAFTRPSDGNDAPQVPTTPVYTTAPVAGRCLEESNWQFEDLIPPSLPTPFRWPRSFLDSSLNSVNRTRKPLPLLDTGWVGGHSYDQIQHTDSVSANQEFPFDYTRRTRRADAGPLPASTIQGDRAFQPLMPESQSALDFDGGPFSLFDVESFTGFPSSSNFRTPYVFDTNFLNGLGIFV